MDRSLGAEVPEECLTAMQRMMPGRNRGRATVTAPWREPAHDVGANGIPSSSCADQTPECDQKKGQKR